MKSILFIEDDPASAETYMLKLREKGFAVEVVGDGLSALQKLKEKFFDLIVLDIVLPQLNGWEFLEKVRNDPKLKDLKIVILSNLGQKEEVEKIFLLGIIKYFIKVHYTPQEFAEEIKKILEK